MATGHPSRAGPRPERRPDGPSPARRPGAPSAPGMPDIAVLQRLAGNRAVAQLLTVQRCGATPADRCGCHDEDNPTTGAPERPPEPLQRSAAAVVVQRHAGFRTKAVLETPALAVPELQTAASSAARALEVGKSSGAGVQRLQEALTTAGFGVPVTATFDAATRQAVARFQAEHGIPYPTGRQAGPKTLSTLDDHLLGRPAPPPVNDCATYAVGEREASLASLGVASRSGTFGKELRLFDFAAGADRLKPRHTEALDELLAEFALADPCQETWGVQVVLGFTDSVDREDRNAELRAFRALSVSEYLHAHGVPGAPDGVEADPASYDPGCDPAARRLARAAVVRLVKLPRPAVPKCGDTPPPTPDFRVEVLATGIPASLGAFKHLFVVHTGERGRTAYRAGPGVCPKGPRPDGEASIMEDHGRYAPGFIDWDPEAASVVALSGEAARDKDACLLGKLLEIDNGCLAYAKLGPNSNTVARTLLERCGIPQVRPDTNAVGWDDKLPSP
jgi:outer membrane protein OmpA-like peptidoglycan-associated protein